MSVDAAMYARVFEGHHEGRLVLEDLQARYYDTPQLFVPGAQEGDRATAFNLGARSVVQFIFGRIAQVQDVEEPNAS